MGGDASQRKRTQVAGLVAVLCLLIASLFLRALVDGDSPWVWVGVVIQAIAVVTVVVYLVRAVRRQRGDYWKERGRNPRDPK